MSDCLAARYRARLACVSSLRGQIEKQYSNGRREKIADYDVESEH